MEMVPAYVWLQIGAYALTLLAGTAGAVWFFSQIKAGFEKGLLQVEGRINLLNQSVQPYAKDIEELKDGQKNLSNKLTALEVTSDGAERTAARLEARIDQIVTGKR